MSTSCIKVNIKLAISLLSYQELPEATSVLSLFKSIILSLYTLSLTGLVAL